MEILLTTALGYIGGIMFIYIVGYLIGYRDAKRKYKDGTEVKT